MPMAPVFYSDSPDFGEAPRDDASVKVSKRLLKIRV